MGIIKDLERNQGERNKRQTEELIDSFGGHKGCLRIIFLPITWPFYILIGIGKLLMPLVSFGLNLTWKILFIFIILIISVGILLPLKLSFYIISFGRWNGFENKFIERIKEVYNAEGFYFLSK